LFAFVYIRSLHSDANLLCGWQMLSLIVFTLGTVSFDAQIYKYLMKYILHIFSFAAYVLGLYPRNHCQIQHHEILPYVPVQKFFSFRTLGLGPL
jgi:hypothetical protein